MQPLQQNQMNQQINPFQPNVLKVWTVVKAIHVTMENAKRTLPTLNAEVNLIVKQANIAKSLLLIPQLNQNAQRVSPQKMNITTNSDNTFTIPLAN